MRQRAKTAFANIAVGRLFVGFRKSCVSFTLQFRAAYVCRC